MPRLVLFGVCQKAIWDGEDRAVSLIAVMGGINVRRADIQSVQDGEDNNENQVIAAPHSWSAVAIWRANPGDEERTFEQKVEVVDPLERVSGGASTPFVVQPNAALHTVRVGGEVLPVGVAGQCRFRLSLREAIEGSEWSVMTEYPLDVTHVD
jgi:hypothetical protein